MRTTSWLVPGLAVILVLCLALVLGAGLLGYVYPGGTMERWGGYGCPGGMMGGWDWGIGGLLVIGMMWLVPLGLLALLVLGVVWLVHAGDAPAVQSAPAATCPACHKNIQSDWQNCPYCGKTLRS